MPPQILTKYYSMSGRLSSYTILCVVYAALAIGVTYEAYVQVPLVYGSSRWLSIFWFALFAALSDFLEVRMDNSDSMMVTPTVPIVWAATSVIGPIPALIALGTGHLVSQFVAGSSYYLLAFLASRAGAESSNSRTPTRWSRVLTKTSASWHPAAFWIIVQVTTSYLSQLALGVGVSGLIYQWLGGRFLLDGVVVGHALETFVLPFLAMVLAQAVIEGAVVASVFIAFTPMPGARGLYGLLLRAKLAIIEISIPVWRGEAFLVVVALLLAYLYAHVGVMGFVLTAMPVLALRDFFDQWMKEKGAYLETITTLATYMQYYHPYTRGHLKRVADMSERLARELRLPAESVMHMRNAGFLHDIGKVGVSEQILDKVEKLTDEEWNTIKQHPVKGAEIISHIEFLDQIVDWIKYHHKWHNGGGYPSGNGSPEVVPIEAAIISVADAFDAMTDDRELALEWQCDSCGYNPGDGSRPEVCPKCGVEKRRTYRKPKNLDDAINELRRGAGTQFHPGVVQAFLSMVARDGIHLNA